MRSTYGLSWVSTSIDMQSLAVTLATDCGNLWPRRSGLNLSGDERSVKINIESWSNIY